jgi:signal-transduction protein with cAMP-binding, CBS, and nucleotidyltransferase domain
MFWSRGKKTPKTIGQVMTRNPKSISPNHHVATALKTMSEMGVRHLPVVERDVVLTVVSDRDFEMLPKLFPGRKQSEILIDEFCLFDPYIVAEDAPLLEVLERMLHEKIGCAVVTKEKKLSGIFTMVDAGRLLIQLLK